MRKLRDQVTPSVPEDYLRLATESASPAAAATLATAGLDAARDGIEPDVEVLLLREVFKGHVHAGRPRSAHAVARKMVRVGALSEIANADLGRACAALGWFVSAAQAYRIAARFAPARRRSLHWGSCASAFQNAKRFDEALAALDRALRWSTTTRPLHRAHVVLVRIDAGRPQPEEFAAAFADLEASRCGEGYGRYVLGLLALSKGNAPQARTWLREFVRRNARDAMRAATLTGELSRARSALRTLSS